MYFDLSDQERASFLAYYRFTSIEGPNCLLRFSSCDCKDRSRLLYPDDRCGLYRGYWMFASAVGDLMGAQRSPQRALSTNPGGLALLRKISEGWAICDDWSDLQCAWALKIPKGERVDGYIGKTKFQPHLSRQKQKDYQIECDEVYAGGQLQLVLGLRVGQLEWIKGPLSSVDLSPRKLRHL